MVLTGRRFRFQGFLASVSALVLGAGLLVGANVVAADSVQVQSYERASQAAECPNQPWETPWQADWGPDSSWAPSWEQWPNSGTGGWTCTRSIVWARSPTPAGDPHDPVAPAGAPTGLTGVAGDGQVTVSWIAPASDGGSAITGYTVTSSPDSRTCTTATTSCVVTGLTNGTAYTFTATAANAIGTSSASTPSAAVTPAAAATAPGAPTGLTGVAGDGQVTVSWIAPASDGGSAITGYTVTSSPDSRTCTTATTSCVVTGLTNGTAYTFTATAANAIGTSSASTPSALVALPCKPEVSCRLGDIGPGGGLVFLISGGKTYEMAPKNWSGATSDPNIVWCNIYSNVTGATGTAIGTGSANTTAMVAECTSGAGNSARLYTGGGFTDWFLPSKDEMNALCNYSRNPANPPTGLCNGSQDSAFAAGPYAYSASGELRYWSSSQSNTSSAWAVYPDNREGTIDKGSMVRVRPVRAF